MNHCELLGRPTRDPEVRYSQGENSLAIARFILAVDRRFKKDNEQSADFIPCVAFGKTAEFCEKYIHQGTKIALEGHIQTGNYTDKDGNRVYTMEIVVNSLEFAGSKADNNNPPSADSESESYNAAGDGYMNIPEGIDDGYMHIDKDDSVPFN